MKTLECLSKYKAEMTQEQKIEKAWQYAQAALVELERRIKLAKKEMENGKLQS